MQIHIPPSKRVDALLLWLRDGLAESVRQGYDRLTLRQLAILLVIYSRDERPTVRGLAAILHVSRPVVSRSLDRLCGAGFARRVTDPRDRRSVLVHRTRQGAQHVAQLHSLMQDAAAASIRSPSLAVDPDAAAATVAPAGRAEIAVKGAQSTAMKENKSDGR